MSWEGKARQHGLEATGQRESRDHDITAVKSFKHGFPILSDKVTLISNGTTGVDNSWQNPYPGSILILDAFLDITTQASGSATADVGVGSTATTSDDTLMDAADVGAAVVFLTASNDAGDNGGTGRVLLEDYYVTVDWKADPASLVGTLFVLYVPLG